MFSISTVAFATDIVFLWNELFWKTVMVKLSTDKMCSYGVLLPAQVLVCIEYQYLFFQYTLYFSLTSRNVLKKPKTALTQSYCLQWGQWGQCVWLRLCESLCQFLPESESIIQVVRLHIVGCGTVCLCLFDFWPFGACVCVCVGGGMWGTRNAQRVFGYSLSGGTKWVKVIKQALANSFLVYCPSNEQIQHHPAPADT